MEQVLPGSEGAMQEQQEQYPNGWPKITARQERIKLGLPAEMPPSPGSKTRSRRPLVIAAVSAVAFLTGAAVGAAATGKRWRAERGQGQVGTLKAQVADLKRPHEGWRPSTAGATLKECR